MSIIFTRLLYVLAFCSLMIFQLPAQTFSRFDFNSTATMMTATTGPNASYINPVSVAPGGVAYITAGCGAGVGMDMSVGGPSFDVNNITVRVRFQRGPTEGTGNFFVRDQFRFGFVGGRLFAIWMVLESGFLQTRVLATSRIVASNSFHEYEFWYDNCTGEANILDNDISYGFADFADNCPLVWFGGDAFIGSELDNACNQTPGIDWIVVAGNADGCRLALPIELGEFSGKMTETGTELRWTTISETNNDYFNVERSADGMDFEDFARAEGAGNSQEALQYTAIDPSPFAGVTYYRLRQTDFDGQSSVSEIIQVATDLLKEKILVGPNPGEGLFNISMIGGQEHAYQITIRNVKGALIRESKLDTSEGYVQQLDLRDLNSGIYFLQIRQGTAVYTHKLMIRH
jgi:hypothetical protein